MPPFDPGSIAIAAVITVAGATALSAVITGLIAMAKSLSLPFVNGNEPRVAAVLALLFVIWGVASAVQQGLLALDLQGLFIAFTAWYTLTRLSMSIHDDVSGSDRSLTAGLKG